MRSLLFFSFLNRLLNRVYRDKQANSAKRDQTDTLRLGQLKKLDDLESAANSANKRTTNTQTTKLTEQWFTRETLGHVGTGRSSQIEIRFT